MYQDNKVEDYLFNSMGNLADQIVSAITADPGTKELYFIQIPDPSVVDLHPNDLASLVVKTSNGYAYAARLAGLARATLKIAEARYKYKFKQNKFGQNEAEREQKAMAAAQDEYNRWIHAQALVEAAEVMEMHARIASESARKLYDKVTNINSGYNAASKGHLQEKDWSHDF